MDVSSPAVRLLSLGVLRWRKTLINGHVVRASSVAGESRDLRAAERGLREDASVVVALAAELVALCDADAHAGLASELERDL